MLGPIGHRSPAAGLPAPGLQTPWASARLILGAVLTCAWLAASVFTASAAAAVELRASTCNSSTTSSVSVARPAGLAAGDLMLMAVIHEGSDFNATTPSGWTVLPSSAYAADTDDRSLVFYRRATGSEPASWTVSSSDSNAMAVALDAFSGVHATTPFSATVALTSGTSTALTLPSATASASGSMRWSSVGHWPAYGQSGRTVTFSAELTETCDRQGNGSFGQVVGMASAHEATGAGAVASRSATFSAGVERWVAWTLVLTPAGPTCGGGALTLSPPTSISFPSREITGTGEAVAPAGASITVDDQTSAATGWNLSATSTPLTSGSRSLPLDAVEVTSVTPAALSGNCAMPTNAVGYPVTLPAGSPAPAAAKLFNAASGSGRGPLRLDLALELRAPANSYVGTYTSTWTFTLAASP